MEVDSRYAINQLNSFAEWYPIFARTIASVVAFTCLIMVYMYT